MPDDSIVTYQISVSELDKLLDLCQRALDGLSKASQMTKANRQSVRNAVGDTCELIDTILTTVKQRLSAINKALIADDPNAAGMIADLGNASDGRRTTDGFIFVNRFAMPPVKSGKDCWESLSASFLSRTQMNSRLPSKPFWEPRRQLEVSSASFWTG